MDKLLIAIAIVGLFIPFFIYAILLLRNKASRAERILSNTDRWGKEYCQALAKGEVELGMTQEMILEAFGPPTKIGDEKTMTGGWLQPIHQVEDKYQEWWAYTWVYQKFSWGPGSPVEKIATNTLTFEDGQVTDITEQRSFQNLVEKQCAPFSEGMACCLVMVIMPFLYGLFMLGAALGAAMSHN
jgi:hypothetical protein